MIKLLDVVRLVRPRPELKLEKGMIGAVVIVHQDPPGFEVEFCDSLGKTIGIAVIQEADLEVVP